jgi:hypothetical protein
MSLARLVYRTEQFRKYLGLRAAPLDLGEAQKILTPAQMALFLRMQAGEQAHSLEVFRRLRQQGQADPDLLVDDLLVDDLLVAALLHDAGKCRFPLRLWERVWVVLAQAFFPVRFRAWGAVQGDMERMPWWMRACAVAVQHPAWGAELAQAAGCSQRAVSLIRRHQEHSLLALQTEEDQLLARLQALDDQV